MALPGSQLLVLEKVSSCKLRGSQLEFLVLAALLCTARSLGLVGFRTHWRRKEVVISQQVWSKRCRFYIFSDKNGLYTVAMPY